MATVVSTDALFCINDCEDSDGNPLKMRTMQGAAFFHENKLLYWRRKKCPKCGHIQKTVEVPADILTSFVTKPTSAEMS